MDALELIKNIKSGNIDVVENTHKAIEQVKKINNKYNYMNNISEELALKQAKEVKKNPKGRLAGLPITVKDCLCVKDVETTAGSAILKGYKPVFNATAVQNAINEGAIILGKTSQDEFGFGSFNVNVGNGFKIPLNPVDETRVTGGSSGGSAGITRKVDFPHVSIAESTGGSIAAPASFCGVYGFTPTYGIVSRYGMIDYASSLDKIGIIAKSVKETKLMFEVIAGRDEKDSTSLQLPKITKPKKLKYAIIKEAFESAPELKNELIAWLDKEKIKYDTISLPLTTKYANAAYYILAMAEASTNLAKYCGLRYGHEEQLTESYNDYFTKVRTNSLGKEAKRRIILGTFTRMAGYRDAYYMKALKTRTLIITEYKNAFKKYNLLISPTMPMVAPKIDEANKLSPLKAYQMDTLTVGPNLAGFPHLNIPAAEHKGLPIGLMMTVDHFNDSLLL